MKKTKAATLKKAYKTQRDRIMRFMKKYEAVGVLFDVGLLPNRPKKITEASIRRLKKLTGPELLKKSTWVDLETGEVMGTGTRYKMEKRKAKAQERAKQKRETEKRKRGEEDKMKHQRDLEQSLGITDEMKQTTQPDKTAETKAVPIEHMINANMESMLRRLFSVTPADMRRPDVGDKITQRLLDMEAIYNRKVKEKGSPYLKWLNMMAEKINMLIDEILLDSDQNEVEASVGALYSILNEGINKQESMEINATYSTMETPED